MFQQMYTGIGGDGPFGGSGATGVWRSLLTEQYAKSFAKAGGIGIASQVYQQPARPSGGATSEPAEADTSPARPKLNARSPTSTPSWTG